MDPIISLEKRKMLQRSTGSFSVIEDHIIAPTPRKVPNVSCSPRLSRRERQKSSDEKLFGEAGHEIQNIFLPPASAAVKPLPITEVLSDELDVKPTTVHLEDIYSFSSSKPVIVNLLRASNPVTSSSPFFHLDESPFLLQRPKCNRVGFSTINAAVNGTTINNRIYPKHERQIRAIKKDLNRGRSFSWPGIPIATK